MRHDFSQKQPYLRPQDIVIALKISLNGFRHPTYQELAQSLYLSTSEVYNSTLRLKASSILSREHREFHINRIGLREFLIHGVKYAFPAQLGAPKRGILTGIDGCRLREAFNSSDGGELVWPDPEGDNRGTSIMPFYPKVPRAVRFDPELHEALALVDVLRAGAAREREKAAYLLGTLV